MKTLARQITVDMYNCKAIDLDNKDLIFQGLYQGIAQLGYNIIDTKESILPENKITIFVLLSEGHFTFCYYPKLSYISCDFFICKEMSKPENAINILRKLVKAEKTRMTYLKRGDFGTLKDIKPKIKVRTARLRQLRSKSAKVIRNVANKIKVKQ